MAKKKAERKMKRRRGAAGNFPPDMQRANQLSGQLVGDLKSAAKAYIRVGQNLAIMRDEKLYAVLKYRDMPAYAFDRLGLGRSSMYRYLDIYDWVRESHPEWLQTGWKGKIPDLALVPEFIWIEKQLEQTGLDAETRAKLEDMRKRGLAGKLDPAEVRRFRRHGHSGDDSLKAALATLRSVRARFVKLAKMPPEVISSLDDAINALDNATHLKNAELALKGLGSYAPLRMKMKKK